MYGDFTYVIKIIKIYFFFHQKKKKVKGFPLTLLLYSQELFLCGDFDFDFFFFFPHPVVENKLLVGHTWLIEYLFFII